MSDVSANPDGRTFPRLGSYQILRQLGSGGMSNVFQAIHEESGSIVALKVLPRKLAQNATLLQRFLREAKSAENLDHPNIVAIYDRGFDQGRHYLVLEYVEGRDLYDRVRIAGPLKTEEAVRFIREVAFGMQYAAKLGMIHRDIKPANLLLTPDGHAKIIDLGLALQADDEDERVTRDGTTVGTVDYMSPEQARDSRKISERSDIYSLGCTLHYLMTGSPPFPGGNLADKLARHHSGTIPDVRDRVPEIPADFARLIQRMMAKKPEQRYRDYQEMIEALDLIGKEPKSAPGASLPDVLIDDADDDDDDVLELTVAQPSAGTSEPRPDQIFKTRETIPINRDPGPFLKPEISLADLAALDAEPSASAKHRAANIPIQPVPTASQVESRYLDEGVEEVVGDSLRRSRDELPLRTWVAAGVMVGLVLAVVGFTVRFTITLLASSGANQATAIGVDAVEVEPGTENRADDPAGAENSGTYAPSPKVVVPTKPRPQPEPVGPSRSPGSIPDQTRKPGQLVYDPAVIDRLGFDRSPSVRPVDSPNKVTLRRLAEPGDPIQALSLSNALGRAADLIEIADVGPFHEDEFPFTGKTKLIRGKSGLRPILKVEKSRQPLVRELEAKFILGGGFEQLTLEGIDIVVDVRDLPSTQSSLIICRGVELVLRDCSVTLVNADDRPNGFSVIHLETGPRPNKITLERCLIRGPIRTLIDGDTNRAEMMLGRSLILGGDGPLFRFDPGDRTDRSLKLDRCVLASRGPLIGWEGRPSPISIRSFATLIAHVAPAGDVPLMSARNTTEAEVARWLDYDGDYNRWLGWAGFARWGVGQGAAPAPTRRDGTKPDLSSLVASEGWPASTITESIRASDLANELTLDSPTLDVVAVPHPYLLELTVDLFRKQTLPEPSSDVAARGSPPLRPSVELSYQAQPGNPIDLGQFLAARVVDPSKHYLIKVLGSGSHYMTPVRLPDGTSVALVGPRGSGSAPPIPSFFAVRAGSALIELKGGDLTIENLGFGVEASRRTRRWLAVEDGVLVIRGCTFRDPSATDDSAIEFKANLPHGTRAVGPGSGAEAGRPYFSMSDCWVWTAGNGIAAEISQGLVRLENCIILAGSTALSLTPGTERLADLEADILVENCTIFAEKFVVSARSPASLPSGTGRPWLIQTRASVFPRGTRDGSALLAADPALFALGAFFWQSSKDLYEVGRFLAPNDLAANAPAVAADLNRQWVDLWGSVHARDDRGPLARSADRVLHFRDSSRARTTRPTPGQLELDPKLHRAQGADFKSLPALPRS